MEPRLSMVDTSVLLAACVPVHPNYASAVAAIKPVVEAGALVLSAHCLLETYSNLTALPVRPRIAPHDASEVVRAYAERAKVVALTSDEYLHVIHDCATRGLAGGVVYDALHAAAARKAAVTTLFTYNIADFLRVWPDGRDIIRHP